MLGHARVYVCGITPYETTHVGHAATFVWADVATRVLRLVGATVEVCRNVTDIDDHLLIQAKRDGVPWRSLAVQETYRFERDMAQLGVTRPTYEPRSRDYVDEVIALTAGLLATDSAYERNGSVYFRGTDAVSRAGLDRPAPSSWRATTAVTPTIPTRTIRWTRHCGNDPSVTSRHGRVRGAPAARGGMPSAPRCRWRRLARLWTSTSAGKISPSRITPTRRPRQKRSRGPAVRAGMDACGQRAG